jgi:hypothetical protein
MTSDMTRSGGSYLVWQSNVRIGDPYWWPESKEMGWRFAISPQAYASAAFTEMVSYMQRFAKLENVPYATAKTETAAIVAESKKSSNHLVSDILPDFSALLATQRVVRAKLRVLRAGIAVLTTSEMPVIRDPFGTNIRYRSDANSFTVWSLGRDGKDQNGDGEYTPDISLTIPR